MAKDFVQIANDVIEGVGLIRGIGRHDESVRFTIDGGDRDHTIDTKRRS